MATNPSHTRRQVLGWGAALSASLVSCGKADDVAPPIAQIPLTDLSAADAVSAMVNGETSAEAYASALLAQCEKFSHLNAFISLEPDRVLAEAKAADARRAAGQTLGPLHGLPIPVKDSVNTKDYPTTGGTPALMNFRPTEDAKLVRMLRDAGAIVMGKTNIHEMSFGWTSNNYATGAVRNPYDTDRIPGGSSGGTAAAIAAHMAPLGIAEDTQGSIRVPAALCGIAGFRPTLHRYPNDGVMPLTPLFDQVGPHARSVSDLQLFDSVISGEPTEGDVSLNGVRLGMAKEYFYGDLDEEVEKVLYPALQKLSDAGVELVEANVPDLERLISLTTYPSQSITVLATFNAYLEKYNAGITMVELLEQASPDIRQAFTDFVLPGGKIAFTMEEALAAENIYIPELQQTMRTYFADHNLDAMVFPTTMAPASPIGMDINVPVNGIEMPIDVAMARNISPGSTAGIPGLVVPAGLSSTGLPVSLELDGPAGSDRKMLAMGLAIEKVLGTLPPPPNA